MRCGEALTGAADHDHQTKVAVAGAIAALLGCPFAGATSPPHKNGRLATSYVVPSHTLTIAEARTMGIADADRFFGGIVPRPYVATKLISHPLIARDAARPTGWVHRYGQLVRDAVLPGFSVFSHADALAAGERLLEHARLRVKEPDGVGGSGQHVVHDRGELRACLDTIGADRIAREGLVLESHLEDVRTHSVGQVQVGSHRAAYVGTQRLTRNGRGLSVYGGSALQVVRGDLAALRGLPLGTDQLNAIAQASRYDAAAHACFRGLVASRRNYDIATGTLGGRTVCGVLEQSWRIGGASGAEVAAMHRLRDKPSLRSVRSRSYEIYDDVAVPPLAWVTFRGVDAHGHPLTKYVEVEE